MHRQATAPAALPVADIVTVTATTVACDGGGGALGHPRVFLTLVQGRAVCPYCSRLHVLAGANPGANTGANTGANAGGG